jgi:hypothetical protein
MSGGSTWLDVDHDGDMDFICSGYYGPYSNGIYRFVLFTNNGNAVFTEQLLSPPLPNEAGAIAAADYNNDLYPDFAAGGQALSSAAVLPRIFKNTLGTGINESKAEQQFYCFPSPTAGIVNLVMNQCVEQGTFTVYDVNGRALLSQNLTGEDTFSVDLSSFTPGVYIVRVTAAENTFVCRIVKQ